MDLLELSFVEPSEKRQDPSLARAGARRWPRGIRQQLGHGHPKGLCDPAQLDERQVHPPRLQTRHRLGRHCGPGPKILLGEAQLDPNSSHTGTEGLEQIGRFSGHSRASVVRGGPRAHDATNGFMRLTYKSCRRLIWGMLLAAAKCPECGADVAVPPQADRLRCSYCQRDILIRPHGPGSPAVANLMALADAALDASNFDEAYGYYTRVLETDPGNVLAWFGKGVAAGWSSNLRRDRFQELLSGVDRAIGLAHDDLKPSLRDLASNTIANVSLAYYRMSFEHLAEFAALEGSWPEHVSRTRIILLGLEGAHVFSPKNRQVMEAGLMLAQYLLEGIQFANTFETDDDGDPVLDYHNLDPHQRAEVQAIFDAWVQRLKSIDPTYQPPKVKEVGPGAFSSCLIGLVSLVMLIALGYGAWWVVKNVFLR